MPAGLDSHRVRIQSRVLLAKRGRAIRELRPDLADVLGERLGELFAAWTADHPPLVGTPVEADAAGFAAWLADNGWLPRRRPARWRRRRRG